MWIVGKDAQRQALQPAGGVSNLTGVKTITRVVFTLVGHYSSVCVNDLAIGIDRTFVEFDLDIVGFQAT